MNDLEGGVMKIFGLVFGAVATLALLIGLAFVLEVGGLQWKMYFAPKHENVRREVFEETQSYVHGKIQDLAKYKGEYDKADDEGKEAIRHLIVIRFAEFDDSKIKASGLRGFLVKMRGY